MSCTSVSSLRHCSASRKALSLFGPLGVVACVTGFLSNSSFLTAVEKIGDKAERTRLMDPADNPPPLST